MALLQLFFLIESTILIGASLTTLLKFTIEPEDISLFPHETALLHCSAISPTTTKLYYQWSYKGFFLKSENILQNGSLLVGGNAIGCYRCFVSDSFGTIRSKTCTVKKAGIFAQKIHLNHFTVKDKSFILLPRPVFKSNPPITSFRWEIRNQTTKLWRPISNVSYTTNGSLFTQVTSESGLLLWYRFVVEQASKLNITKEIMNISVSITYKTSQAVPCPSKNYTVFQAPRSVTVFVGDDIVLEGLVAYEQCRDKIQVGWLFNTTHISSTSLLLIKNATMALSGAYTFFAFGDGESYHEYVKVDVIEKPTIQDPSKQVTVHVDNKSTILNVDISRSTLPYAISWFVDGFKIQKSQKYALLKNGSLKINSIDRTDSGFYQTIFIVKKERLLSTIKLVVTDDIPECGGKVVATHGMISFFNVTTMKNLKYSFFCKWFVKIPTQQITEIHFEKFSFTKTVSCDKTHINIWFRNQTYQGKRYKLCTSSPSTWRTNFSENGILVTAYVNPDYWRDNGFILSFSPKKERTISTHTVATKIIPMSTTKPVTNTMSRNSKTIVSIVFATKSDNFVTPSISYSSKIPTFCCPSRCSSCCVVRSGSIKRTVSHSVCQLNASKSVCVGCVTCCGVSTGIKRSYTTIVIVLAVAVVVILLLCLGLCLCRKHKKKNLKGKHAETKGRKPSLFASKQVTQSQSDLVNHMELEENDTLAPCDEAFFGSYFAAKHAKNPFTENPDEIPNHTGDAEAPNFYATLKEPAHELNNLENNANNPPVHNKDTNAPVYKELESQENVYANTQHDDENTPVYQILAPESENFYQDPTLSSNNYQPLETNQNDCSISTTNQDAYQALKANQNTYEGLLTNQDTYQALVPNQNNLYADPVISKNEPDTYQSLTPTGIELEDSNKKSTKNVPDISIEDEGHAYQPLVASPAKSKKGIHLASDLSPSSTASLPSPAKLSAKNMAHLSPALHKSGSYGGKYETEDYVLM
ncbi:uncharacterized protein LOC130649522 [Hydractinia symbiolongicarpus]|uniref:uncharacterized protein LOC130649522 n=1 Tax=Hydractinia symbiolongicarpus TaxID=13093 RepID=UPI00254CC3E4|nr:uncharacterized protein LOC130649522 [Hydractinia symbiolongicarpus]